MSAGGTNRTDRRTVSLPAPCIAPECPNLADYGVVCGQHMQTGPLTHLGWAVDRLNATEAEVVRLKAIIEEPCPKCGWKMSHLKIWKRGGREEAASVKVRKKVK